MKIAVHQISGKVTLLEVMPESTLRATGMHFS
jgi:hypothetical protein